MAEIKTDIWGAEEDWVDVITNYGADVPVKDRVQYASLDDESASTFENYILAGKIRVGKPIDQSLCYAGLGDKMPLSNISNTAGCVGWRNQEDGNTPYRSYTANLQTTGNRDLRSVTNYIFGTWNVSTTINKEQYGEQLYIKSAKRNDRFHQFWLPDSAMGNIINWTSSEKEASVCVNTKLLARVPVKNMIAIPIVKCLSTVSTVGATASYVDLLTYIDPTSNTNYTTHPYVVMVGLIFAVAQNGVTTENINRNLTLRLNTLVITSPTNMMKNMPYYDYGAWDKNARYEDEAYHYASCIGPHYRNQVSCVLPIMGLINAPIRTDTKFQDVNVKSDRDGNWDIFDVRFDLGMDEVADKGGGYALPMYSWAGKEPNIYTVEDDNPNHNDQQKYQNSTTYWAWEITEDNVDTFREDVRQATAGFGLFFVEGDANRNLALDAEDMFLGILEDGIGNGLYSHGEDNRNQDQWNWDDAHENDYDANKHKPGPAPDPTPITPEIPGFSLAIDNGSVSYVITKAEWKQIWEDIYGTDNATWKDIVNGLALYGSNPLNAILNFRWYPFNLTGSQTAPVRLGGTVIPPLDHEYHYISQDSEAFVSSQAKFWYGRDLNFVNTRKSKARLFLPFYGFYEIPMAMLIDKTLTIKFQYNMPDDTGLWFIMFDGSIYDYVECSPYIEIPITGDNSLNIAAAKKQRNLQIAGTVAAAAIAVGAGAMVAAPGISGLMTAATETASITGGSFLGSMLANIGPAIADGWLGATTASGLAAAGGAIAKAGLSTANNIMQSAVKIGTLSTNVPIHSTAGDTTFLHLPMYPYLQIFTNRLQETWNEKEYKWKVGIACDKWCKVDAMPTQSLLKTTGLAEMDTSGMELDEIKELSNILQTGFYR